MRKGLTEVVFILDRSGSMSGLEADMDEMFEAYCTPIMDDYKKRRRA